MSPLEETESVKQSDFSQAELLLGKEESFPPPAEVIKYYHFLSEMQGVCLTAGVSSVH